jgi:hypothetical protein
MNIEKFESILKNMQMKQDLTLVSKAKEYASEEDRLHNFKKIADFVGITNAQVAMVLMLKNLVSLNDAIMMEKSMSEEFLDEKIGDPYNYLVLIRALIEDDNA